MNKKQLKVILLLIAVQYLNGCWWSKDPAEQTSNEVPQRFEPQNKETEGRLFSYEKISDGVVAQSGEHTVPHTELLRDPHYKELTEQYLRVKEELASSVGGKLAGRDKMRLAWLESQIFNRGIYLSYDLLKSKYLYFAAKKENLKIQEFIKKNILEKTKADKTKAINYYVEKYLFSLPIKFYKEPPYLDIEIKNDWTPILSKGADSPLRVIMLTGLESGAEKKLLKSVKKISEKYPEVRIEFRPLYNSNKSYEALAFHFQLCFWEQLPEKLTAFLSETSTYSREDLESTFLKEAFELGGNKEELKQCVYEKKYDEALKYHGKYAKFLGVESGPVVFVNGQVFVGAVDQVMIERALDIHLNKPNAGNW